MAQIKNNYIFWYQGNIIAKKFCSVRVLDYWCKEIEEKNKLEVNSVTYQKETE